MASISGLPVQCWSFANHSVCAVFLDWECVCRKKADVFKLLLLPVLSALNCGYIFKDSLLQKCVKYLQEKNC